MNRAVNISDDRGHQADDANMNFGAGWRGRWFGIHRLGIVQADIRVVAVSTAIVVASAVVAAAVVWSRVSTLWG